MKNRLSLMLLVLALVHYGASAPQQANDGSASGSSPKAVNKKVSTSASKQTKAGTASVSSLKTVRQKALTSAPKPTTKAVGVSGSSSQTESQSALTSPQGFAFDQMMRFFKPKAGKDLTVGKKKQGFRASSDNAQGAVGTHDVFQLPPRPTMVNVPSVSRVQNLVAPTPAFNLPVKPVAVNVPGVVKVQKLAVLPPMARVPAVTKINQEVQNIISLNRNIKRLKEQQSTQLENVKGQEVVQHAILDEQAKGLPKVESDQKKPEAKVLLAQEKLRTIHEKTQRNVQMANDLKNIPDAAGQGSEEKS